MIKIMLIPKDPLQTRNSKLALRFKLRVRKLTQWKLPKYWYISTDKHEKVTENCVDIWLSLIPHISEWTYRL